MNVKKTGSLFYLLAKILAGFTLGAGISACGTKDVVSEEKLLAFPSAEGYGKYTVGGRGGDVYEVTNLNDAGKGSLREGVEAEGARTIIFQTSGTILLKSDLRIQNPYITIAGQTAPGDGITLRGYPLLIGADEVVIRYIRVRLGDESGDDTDAISSRTPKILFLTMCPQAGVLMKHFLFIIAKM